MKENILFICNTYYQLILAMQLRETLLSEDDVSVIISDHSRDALTVYNNLAKLKVFNKVYYIETRYLAFSSAKPLIVWQMVFGNPEYKFLNEKKFDKLFYYNFDEGTHIIYATILKRNPDIECCQFEEGILSYNNGMGVSKKIRLSYFFKKNNLYNRTTRYYCLSPELYKGRLETVKIPEIDGRSVPDALSHIFLEKRQLSQIKEEYIYFSGVYDFEGGESVKEIDLISSISNLVGKDNLLVKVHPRDDIKRFLERGLHVDPNSNAPWEAIQLNADFHNKKFLTLFSGSVLSVNMLLDKPAETYFLYPLCHIQGNEGAMKSKKVFEELFNNKRETDGFGWVHVVENIQEITEDNRGLK